MSREPLDLVDFIAQIAPALDVAGETAAEQARAKIELATQMYVIRGEYITAGMPDEAVDFIDMCAAMTRPSAMSERGSWEAHARARYACARETWSLVFQARLKKAGVR